jgi:hypothetical protein
MQAQQRVQPQPKPKAPAVPVQARTQEEAAARAREIFQAKPKAEAKTGRNFFEPLKPEKVIYGYRELHRILFMTHLRFLFSVSWHYLTFYSLPCMKAAVLAPFSSASIPAGLHPSSRVCQWVNMQ